MAKNIEGFAAKLILPGSAGMRQMRTTGVIGDAAPAMEVDRPNTQAAADSPL